MKIIILGEKSATRLKTVIEGIEDSIKVTVYSNINDFVTSSSLHKKNAALVDRFIILQDIFKDMGEDELKSLLITFNNYLCKYYPSSKVITLGRNKRILEFVSDALFSPTMLHIHIDTINHQGIINIATLNINTLKKIYENKVLEASSKADILEEDTISHDEKPKLTVATTTTKKQTKKGFLDRFRKKSKNNDTILENEINLDKNSELINPIGQITDEDNVLNENNLLENSTLESDGNTLEPENIYLSEKTIYNADDIQIDPVGQMIYTSNAIITDESIIEKNIDSEDPVETQIEEDSENSDSSYIKDDIQAYISTNNPYDAKDTIRKIEINNIDNTLEELNEFSNCVKNSGEIIDINIDKNNNDVDITEKVEEIDTLSNDLGDISYIVKQFDEARKPKVIEKIIEKKVTIKDKKTNKEGLRTIIVTGDRRSYITTTALKLAEHFNKSSRVLYVDFDIKNKGSLSYLDMLDILHSEAAVQQGLKNLRKLSSLTQLTYKTRIGFDSLISVYDIEVTEDDIKRVQSILAVQKYYNTIIIDCPIEYIKYLKDIAFQSDVLICCDNTTSGRINTIISLSSLDSNTLPISIYRGRYIISNGTNSEFTKHMDYLRDIFCLSNESVSYDKAEAISISYDWSALDVINIKDGINPLIEDL